MGETSVSSLYIQDVSQASCVGLSCSASVGSHQRTAAGVIHIMTPFGAIRTVMKTCCLATFNTDSDNNKQGVTFPRERLLSSAVPWSSSSSVVTVTCLFIIAVDTCLTPVLFLELFLIISDIRNLDFPT